MIFFPALSPSQIKAITYATTKELEEENNITNGNHVLNGIDPDDDSEENHNPNSSSSNATAGESRPGSYRWKNIIIIILTRKTKNTNHISKYKELSLTSQLYKHFGSLKWSFFVGR